MTPAILVIVVAVVVLLTAAWSVWTAGRLDRMHLRCEGAVAALDAALAERRALVLEVAAHPSTDPASAVLLLDAATTEIGTGGTGASGRSFQHESDLSAVLRAVRPDHPEGALWDEIAAIGERVQLARRIHNDVVATTLALRDRRRVRWFRLAGHAPRPPMIAFDDRPAGPDWGDGAHART
jgi:hypothetical protein